VKTERITENTLIRIAIDVLLAHAAGLRGSTEDELRTSVTSELRNSTAPVLPDTQASRLTNTVSSESSNGVAAERPPMGAASLGDVPTRAPGISLTFEPPHSATTSVGYVGGSQGSCSNGAGQ
jgi:hypothetical protein